MNNEQQYILYKDINGEYKEIYRGTNLKCLIHLHKVQCNSTYYALKHGEYKLETVKEFEIGDIVTLDRYNHKDDTERVEVVGYGELPVSATLTYKMNVNGTIIESTGQSIVESKLYKPVPDKDRHEKGGRSYGK